MTLMRWDPFHELSSMRRRMDRLMGEDWARDAAGRGWDPAASMPVPIDVFERDNNLVIRASLPGLKPEDVEIIVTGHTLTIKGEYNDEQEREQDGFHVRERHHGNFQRSIVLPEEVNVEEINASAEDGVLMVKVPKAAETQPKKIPVKGKSAPEAVTIDDQTETNQSEMDQ